MMTQHHDVRQSPLHLQLDEMLASLLRQTSEIIDVRDGLWRLVRALVGLSSTGFELTAVLRRIVEVARDLVDAEYAALGVIGDDHSLRQFVHVGMDDHTVARIGDLPRGRGLLGLLIDQPKVLRLDDLTAHPAAVGVPEHHPDMHSFLGVPIAIDSKVLGNLYLTNSRNDGGFSADDAELVSMLADVAAAAIDKARVHEAALRRQRWLRASNELTSELLGGARTSKVRQLIVERALDLTHAATVTLGVLGDGEMQLVAAAGRNADALRSTRVAVTDPMSRTAVDTGRVTSTDDVTTAEPRVLANLGVDGYGPALLVPLTVDDRTFALVTILRDASAPRFTDDDRSAADLLAAHVALTLEHDRVQRERRSLAVFTDRERIGHDLHDLVIQRLFGAGLELDAIVARDPSSPIADRVGRAIDQIDAAIADLRASIFALHGRRDQAATLSDLLAEITAEAQHLLGFAPALEVGDDVDAAVPDEVAADVLAVAREALANVARHANASSTVVRLTTTSTMIELDVDDDGDGIAHTARRSGLANLTARAERLGGSLDLDSAAGHGTSLRWRVPLD